MKPRVGLAVRTTAARVLDHVLTEGLTVDEAVTQSDTWRALDQRDRNFVMNIVLTTLRHRGEVDKALADQLSKPLPKKSGLAWAILATAIAQLRYLGTPAHAAIGLAVEAARTDRHARHFAGLVNAVLRKISVTPALARDGRINTPDWLFDKWVQSYGPETALSIASAHLHEPTIDVAVKSDAPHWAERLGGELLLGEHVRLPADAGAIVSLPGFEAGAWWVQDVAAGLPVKLLGNVSGKRVLDLCAAPGGKTMQLAARGALVTAIDDSQSRLERLHANLARTGLRADIKCVNVLEFDDSTGFDAVLLDAPCSATGTIRRHPEIPYIRSAAMSRDLTGLQQRLLDRAARLVKPGGMIVYSTCSLERDEGEGQIERFLAENEGYRLAEAAPGLAGVPEEFVVGPGMIRTFPHMSLGESTGMDGFFAAALERRD